MSKYTEGALRAAKLIRAEEIAGSHSTVVNEYDVARLIDRETGLPGLLEALEELIEVCEEAWPTRPAVQVARAALAKARRQTGTTGC